MTKAKLPTKRSFAFRCKYFWCQTLCNVLCCIKPIDVISTEPATRKSSRVRYENLSKTIFVITDDSEEDTDKPDEIEMSYIDDAHLSPRPVIDKNEFQITIDTNLPKNQGLSTGDIWSASPNGDQVYYAPANINYSYQTDQVDNSQITFHENISLKSPTVKPSISQPTSAAL